MSLRDESLPKQLPPHDVAIILGSGWGSAIDALGTPEFVVSMSEIPGFSQPTSAGHAGAVYSITVGTHRVLVFAGRVHAYENVSLTEVVHAVHTAADNGVHTLIITNAAGAVTPDLAVGTPVLISDQLNLTGRSPLSGPQFVNMVDAYSPSLRELALSINPQLRQGVYAGLSGPNYETPAEIRMLATLGADLVGMSTVHETIAARSRNIAVLGISMVTNLAAGITGAPLNHHEVLNVGAQSAPALGNFLVKFISRLP